MNPRALLFTLFLVLPSLALAAWPDLSKPAPAVGGGEKDAALVVGVEQYVAAPSVPGAAQNATDWYLHLVKGLGVPAQSVTLLRNNEASVEKIRKYAAQAATQVKPGGTLWFVFIGHGAPAKDGKDGVLVGFDAQQDADSLYARSIAQHELVSLLGTGPQARTVMVLDACFSGRTGSGAELVKGLQPLIAITPSKAPSSGASTVVLTAARSDQFAGPLPGGDRPAFSYLVLGALRGWGDANHDGVVSAREALDYAQVSLQTLVKDHTQTPELSGPDGTLAKSAREGAPDLTAFVVAPKTQTVPASATLVPGTSVGPQGAMAAVATQGGTVAQAPESQLLTVAVSEFRTDGGGPDMAWLGRSFADGIITQLSLARQVRVVEREFLSKLLDELKLQSSGLVDPTSAVKVGRLLGAKVVVFGSVAMLGPQVVVRGRLVSVERGEALGVVQAMGNPAQLLALQDDVGKQVLTQLALTNAVAQRAGLETTELAFAAYNDLDRLKQLAKGLSPLTMDPARKRRTADYQLALSLADNLSRSYPRLAPAAYYGALFTLQSEDYDSALRRATVGMHLAPTEIGSYLVAAMALSQKNDDQGAFAAYSDITRRFPDDARGWYGLGKLQLRARSLPEAAMSLIGALERTPAVPEAETVLRTLVAGPDGQGLLSQLQRINPRVAMAAAAYRSLFREEPAPTGLGYQVMRTSPALHVGYLVQALSEKASGRLPQAEAYLRSALALRPESPDIHRALGLVLLDERRCEEGAGHLQLYLAYANMVKDYQQLSARISSCR